MEFKLVLRRFIAAATAFGGTAPSHLPPSLVPVMERLADRFSGRDIYEFTDDERQLVIGEIKAAVEAANKAAYKAAGGGKNGDHFPMCFLEIAEVEGDLRISYGGGRTFAALDIRPTGVGFQEHCSWNKLGLRPGVTEFGDDKSPEEISAVMADLGTSLARRAAAAMAVTE